MKLSPKQTAVLAYFRDTSGAMMFSANRTLTLDVAVALIGTCRNARFHVGCVLSNMVKRGMLRRIKPGLFTLPEKKGELL